MTRAHTDHGSCARTDRAYTAHPLAIPAHIHIHMRHFLVRGSPISTETVWPRATPLRASPCHPPRRLHRLRHAGGLTLGAPVNQMQSLLRSHEMQQPCGCPCAALELSCACR